MRKKRTSDIRLPRKNASLDELADFFDRHDGMDRLARRKTVEVSTLVRMWGIDAMRREASGP